METRQGKSVFAGVAIGKLFVYKKATQVVEKRTIEDPQAEIARYMAAKENPRMRTGYSVLYVLVHLDYHENRKKSSGK